jgi:hypothetical protein
VINVVSFRMRVKVAAFCFGALLSGNFSWLVVLLSGTMNREQNIMDGSLYCVQDTVRNARI